MNVSSPRRYRANRGAILAIMIAAAGVHATPPSIEMVGPAQPEAKLPLPAGAGSLRVFSETYKVAAGRGGSAVEYPHSGFVLLTSDGRVLQHIANHHGTQKESPVPVVLAAGRYAVRARSAVYGELTFPVEIAAGRATLVYLTGAGMPTGMATAAASLVRLPNGHVVGVRAPTLARRTGGGN